MKNSLLLPRAASMYSFLNAKSKVHCPTTYLSWKYLNILTALYLIIPTIKSVEESDGDGCNAYFLNPATSSAIIQGNEAVPYRKTTCEERYSSGVLVSVRL